MAKTDVELEQPSGRTLFQTLLRRVGRSLAVYVVQTRPWVPYRQGELWELLEEIAMRHRDWANRLGETIAIQGDVPDLGPFPLAYTRFHDLGLDFLAARVLEDLRGILELAEKGAETASLPTPEVSLLLEIRQGLQGQIEALEKYVSQGKIPGPAREEKAS